MTDCRCAGEQRHIRSRSGRRSSSPTVAKPSQPQPQPTQCSRTRLCVVGRESAPPGYRGGRSGRVAVSAVVKTWEIQVNRSACGVAKVIPSEELPYAVTPTRLTQRYPGRCPRWGKQCCGKMVAAGLQTAPYWGGGRLTSASTAVAVLSGVLEAERPVGFWSAWQPRRPPSRYADRGGESSMMMAAGVLSCTHVGSGACRRYVSTLPLV